VNNPTHNRLFLERRIAYRLQEIEFRKTNPELLAQNKRRIQTIIQSGQNIKRERDIHVTTSVTMI
jgi:hypothetical protein